MRPTLEVNGVWGGGSFTVIPHRAGAHITCRLVPAQQPEAILAAIAGHIDAHHPVGVEIELTPQAGAVAVYAIPADHYAVRATEQALRNVYPDQEPILVRMGATVPAAVIFEEILGVKTLMFSFSTGDEQLHAPNEFFRLNRLDEGMRAWADLWLRLAEATG
jgi:acetylornithine deacetylase/succinyl-diaminopimelate desuccinylase-like protein